MKHILISLANEELEGIFCRLGSLELNRPDTVPPNMKLPCRYITPSALTKVDDTNVTLTLGGTPGTALLEAVSLTLGWTGTLADARIASAATWNAKQNAIPTGTISQYFRGDFSLAPFPTIGTWAALNYPTWTSGTPFVKMTAAGTFSLDTNTYLTSISSSDVTTALGYTPYNATNPSGFITSSALTPYLTIASAASTYQTILAAASGSTNGYLTSTDWTTFNNKVTSPWIYRRAAKWYTPVNTGGQIGSIANVANAIRYIPVILEKDITITQLGINVVSASGAGLKCRVGIYSNDASTTSPLTRQVDSGEFALDATGVKTVTGLSVPLTKGLWWFCYVSNAAAGSVASVPTINLPDVRGTTSLNLGPTNVLSQNYTYAALPASAGATLELQSATAVCVYYQY